jgi:hypothetical protein
VKVAFWRDFAFMPGKVVIAKFFAGAISIGGGCFCWDFSRNPFFGALLAFVISAALCCLVHGSRESGAGEIDEFAKQNMGPRRAFMSRRTVHTTSGHLDRQGFHP